MAIIDRLGEFTQPTGQEDLMEVKYPSARVRIPVRQALALAAVVLVAAVGWLVVSSRPSEAPPPVMVAAEQPTEIVVSIVGAIAHPGLVTLPSGSRVADALAVAAPLPEADLWALNQAQLLVDGQQIVVPVVGQVLHSGSSGISLNSAGLSELQELDGVGEKTAQAIIDYRDTAGGFSSVEELMEVPGIGPSKFEGIRDHVTL